MRAEKYRDRKSREKLKAQSGGVLACAFCRYDGRLDGKKIALGLCEKNLNFNSFCILVHKLAFPMNLCYNVKRRVIEYD